MDKADVKPIVFTVPFTPPSVNHYKKPVQLRTRNGIVRSYARTPEADRFREAVAIFARGASLIPATARERDAVRYSLICTVFLGEGERGDGDNFFKCIADGLTSAGVIHSDARIRSWHIDVEDRDRENPRTLVCVSITEKGQTMAERILVAAAGGSQQAIWFHGTSEKNAESIQREGFRAGTWFARHMEDAIKFGGPYVFRVRVSFAETPLEWQANTSNAIPSSAIDGVYVIGSHSLWEMKNG